MLPPHSSRSGETEKGRFPTISQSIVGVPPENQEPNKLKDGHGRCCHVGQGGCVQNLSGQNDLIGGDVAESSEGLKGTAAGVVLHREGHQAEQHGEGEKCDSDVDQEWRREEKTGQ